MTKLPYMPVDVSAIEGDEDCREMEDAVFGRYMRLLIRQWVEGSVPAEPRRLVRGAMLDPGSEASVKSLLDRKFVPAGGGRMVNTKCDEIRKATIDKVKKNRKNGMKGGRPKNPTDNRSVSNGFDTCDSTSPSDSGSAVEGGECERGKPKKPRAPQPADPLFDALVEVFHDGVLPDGQASIIAKAAHDLLKKGASPDDIRTRYRNAEIHWHGHTFTPPGFVKHWKTLARPPANSGPKAPGRIDAPAGKYDHLPGGGKRA